jgi:hypothetical protein
MRRVKVKRFVVMLMITVLLLTTITVLLLAIVVKRAEKEEGEEGWKIKEPEAKAEKKTIEEWIAEIGLPAVVGTKPVTEEEGSRPAPEEAQPPSDYSVAGFDYNYSSEYLDYFYPQGIGPSIDLYLDWEMNYPEGFEDLTNWGRAFLQGDTANQPPLRLDPAMYRACLIAYEGHRWDCWLEYRDAVASPYYGRGVEIARYLYSRNRSVANCLATLEVESRFGLDSYLDFGILQRKVPFQNYPNTVEGYCTLLDALGVGNDPAAQAWAWNLPGGQRYADGFCRVVRTIEGWYP